jgi:RNA polymerase sigma factor (sigma-70 family)
MEETEVIESRSVGIESLSSEQQKLVVDHIAMVGMHLRKRVPTPRQPTRDRDYDDLFQEGCIGLLRAAARFRPGRDGVFAAFALHRIRGAVHAALHEHFSTIRVPMSAQRVPGERAGPSHEPVQSLAGAKLLDESGPVGSADGQETIRHMLRRRFERAVRLAVESTKMGPHATPQRNVAMTTIAAERLLISDESARTPLRRLADRTGISSGRACDYERRLLEHAREILARDAQTILLIQLARQEPGGFDALLDETHRQRLEAADVRQFERRFADLDRQERAEILYGLVEASQASVEEVARNLYQITGGLS